MQKKINIVDNLHLDCCSWFVPRVVDPKYFIFTSMFYLDTNPKSAKMLFPRQINGRHWKASISTNVPWWFPVPVVPECVKGVPGFQATNPNHQLPS